LDTQVIWFEPLGGFEHFGGDRVTIVQKNAGKSRKIRFGGCKGLV
jgi:hypothetical protein